MTLIRKIAFTLACSGLMVSAPMANARSTSGSVPAFTVSAVGQSGGGDVGGGIEEGVWGDWGFWLGGFIVVVTGGIILGSGSR